MIFRCLRWPYPRGSVLFYHTSKGPYAQGTPRAGAEPEVGTAARGTDHRRDKLRADVTDEKKGKKSSQPARGSCRGLAERGCP